MEISVIDLRNDVAGLKSITPQLAAPGLGDEIVLLRLHQFAKYSRCR